MPLQSHLFRDDKALDACAIRDQAHLIQGARGPHVAKVQAALIDLDGARIDDGELALMRYGPSTARAVLAFKERRQIINHSYQSKADDIVGKMTIARLDQELLAKQEPPLPRLRTYCQRR